MRYSFFFFFFLTKLTHFYALVLLVCFLATVFSVAGPRFHEIVHFCPDNTPTSVANDFQELWMMRNNWIARAVCVCVCLEEARNRLPHLSTCAYIEQFLHAITGSVIFF